MLDTLLQYHDHLITTTHDWQEGVMARRSIDRFNVFNNID